MTHPTRKHIQSQPATVQEPTPEDHEGKQPRTLLLLLFLLLSFGLCGWTLFSNVSMSQAESFIPAPLHSSGVANYAPDEMEGSFGGLSIKIIEYVIRDREPEAENVEARSTELIESLKSPVPTVTPMPGTLPAPATATPTVTDTAIATATTVVSTPLVETSTATATGTVAITPSRTPSKTSSPIGSPTIGSSSTPAMTPSGTLTPTSPPTAEPSASSTKTATPSKTPSASNTPTSGPSATPTPCKVPPRITIVAPLNGATFTMAEELPARAIAYDPDNADPVDCLPVTPEPDGLGISTGPTPGVIMEIKSQASGWAVVFSEDQFFPSYCAFGGSPSCDAHPLNSGEWPNATPIDLGWHKLYVKAYDDDGVWSDWTYVDFYIEPLPTPTPTPSPPPPTPTLAVCPDFALSNFEDDNGSKVWWELTNTSAVSATIVQVNLNWSAGGDLDKIELDGGDIWNGTDDPPSASISSGWTGTSRLLDPSESKQLRIDFKDPINGGTFTVEVHSDNSCVVSDTQTEGS